MPVSRHLVLATVTGFPDTQFIYPCCLCCYTKLLKDQNKDCWLCCKCGQSCRSDEVEWRYRLALTITDGDIIASVCLFGSMLNQFFGTTATQFKRYIDRLESLSCDRSDQMLKQAVEQSFIGHTYYFGFKTTGTINRQGPNVTLRQIVGNLEPKCQMSHENLSHIVAFQILPSTSATQTTVLELMHVDLQNKSSHLTERSSFQYGGALLIKEQENTPVKYHGTRNDPSTISWDGRRSGHSDNTSTLSPSYISACNSSFGQETALLSCDMSQSVSHISCANLSQHNSKTTYNENLTKGHHHEFDTLGKVETDHSPSGRNICAENAPDFLFTDKSSSFSLSFGKQGTSTSPEIAELRSHRLDSSGYSSLLKSSASLEGNSKEMLVMNKENTTDEKSCLKMEVEKESDPFTGSLNSSSVLLACNIFTTKTEPLVQPDYYDGRSARSMHLISKNHNRTSKSPLANISNLSNKCKDCFQGNFNTENGIKDRFEKITSSKTSRKTQQKCDNRDSMFSKESTSDQQIMTDSVVGSVEKIKTSRLIMTNDDQDTVGIEEIPILVADQIHNNNHRTAFPESEDMWAYLTDEEDFDNVGTMGKSLTKIQSKGDNYITGKLSINVYKNKRTDSPEEDSDETFAECFDPEFLALVDYATDVEVNSNKMASYSNENIGGKTYCSHEEIETAGRLDSNYYINKDPQNSGEDVNIEAHHSTEKIDTDKQNFNEKSDIGKHNNDKEVDSRTNDSDEYPYSGSRHSVVNNDIKNSDGDVNIVTQNCYDEISSVETSNIDNKTDRPGTDDSDEVLHTAGTFNSNEEKNNEDISDSQENGVVLLTSSKTFTTISSVPEKHPSDAMLDNPESVINPIGRLESLPDSEDLYAFLDSTFSDATEELSLKTTALTYVLPEMTEGKGEHITEKGEISEDFSKTKVQDIKATSQINNDSKDCCHNLNDLNFEGEIENVRTSGFKKDTKGGNVCVLPSSDETIEQMEDIFEESFDGEETRNEENVHSCSQETIHIQCHPHETDSIKNKTLQSASKSCQQYSYSEKNKFLFMEETADSSCGSANISKCASRLRYKVSNYTHHNTKNTHHGTDSSHHETKDYQECQDPNDRDPCSNPIHDNHSQDLQGNGTCKRPDDQDSSGSCLSQDQRCVSEGLSSSFNTSTDLFGSSDNDSVALCNDTYSQLSTYSSTEIVPNRAQGETTSSGVNSPVKDKEQEKVKSVQFARRLSSVKSIQLIDIEMTMRQNPGLKLFVKSKPCLKIQVASPCSPLCLKYDKKIPKMSKVYSIKKQEKPESQDLFSCSAISEKSCDVTNQVSVLSMPEHLVDVFIPDETVSGMPGTQDLFTPSPVQMSDSASSDFILGSASSNRLNKKFKFPTWKSSHCQTFVSTPLDSYSEKLCSIDKELPRHMSQHLSHSHGNSTVQTSASLFLDSFDELHVINTSEHALENPSSQENYSQRTASSSKRKDMSPVLMEFTDQIKGDNHIPTGDITLDTGSPDLFGTSNISACISSVRSERKVKSVTVAKSFTFPVKRLFLD